MRLKRDLFFTLILFLIIFSISFVSASELTYDSNTDELTTLSVSDVNSIDEDLNDVKLDSVGDDSNDELIDSVDDNLDESELNSIDDTSSPSLDLEDEEQDIDEIESNDCLTLNNKAQLLRASDNEEILGAQIHVQGDTASDVLNAMFDASPGDIIFLDGKTYSDTANRQNWQSSTLNGITVYGGSYIGDTTMAKFTGGGYVFTINDCQINNVRFENMNFTNSMFWFAGASGSISNSVFNNLQCSVQGLCFMGNQGSNRQYPITNCNFTNLHHIYNPNVAQGQYNEFDDGHGQLIAAFGIKMDHCNFVNTSSTNHGGAICIADESRWGSRTVPSTINNTNFINVESKWFAVYIHANFSDSGDDHITSPEIVENCNFINCTGTEEYSACLGISHDDLIVKNCNFVNNTGGQGAAIMVGGLTNADGSLDDAAFNGRNTKGNNISIIGCNFTDNFASRHDTLANQSGLYNYPDGSSGNAGAIYVFGNDTKIIDCQFNNNTAQDGSGAAIYIVGHRTVINGSEFYNHNSDNGTVFILGNNTTINNSNFHDNEAVYTGACVYIEGNNTNVTDSTFRNNKADKGAGIYIKGQNTYIRGSTFDSNNATDGGAVYINGDNSIISSNTFNKNNVTDQGGALFIQGSGSNINQNTFTQNEAVPASAEGTTGLGGAIYVKGDNTRTDTNTFEHNKARNGSAIYTDGKNFNLQHDVFNENQAWSYLLIVDPVPKVSYYNTTDHNITIVHVGGDNIINAIHNTANNNEIHFLDVTYRHSDGDTVNTGNTVVEPVDGAREGVLYQDDRENLQEIYVTVTHVETGNIILNYERYVTNIYGEVNITLKRPTRAVIQLDNPLPVGNYSVYAIHPEDWNYKVIENRSAFEVLPYVDISTEKDSDKDQYYVGDTVIWTITVNNADNGTNATNVTVTDKLPSGFTFISYVATQGEYDSATGVWNIGNMTPGLSVQLTITSVANFADIYDNIANATSNEEDWNLSNNGDNKTVEVLPVVNLTIDKSVNVDTVYVGENVIFTINVTNNGPSNATMVKVEDILPEQFEYVTSNDTSFSGNLIVITKLNVGDSYLFTITAKTLINGTWNNTANATCKENETVVNDTATVTVLPVVNLTIDKSVDFGHVKVGDTVVFTINVTNNGPSNATNVVIEDVVPAQFNVTGCSDPRFENNKLTISYLNKGESIQFTITAIALINGTWNNTANATCDENDTVVNDTVNVTVDPVVNLTIDKTVDYERVYVGDTVVFTINVTNNGPSNATQVVIEDIVPTQFNVTGCNDTSFNNNKIIIEKLNVGQSYAFTITATALIAGTWNNTANVTCAENDTVINDTVTVIVDPVVNLTINKTVEPGRVKVGETVVFTINVTNNGPSNATQVVIEDIVPTQFGNVVCNDTRFENNKITIERLNVGESVVFTLTATALINGTWNNTANVTCAENDTVVNDTVNVTVDPVVNLTIDKAVDYDHVFVGDTIVFTINVTNNGPSNATEVVIEDIVPAQFNVTGCNDTSYVDNKIIIEQLNVGDSYAFTITATTLINGTWNNTANVTCAENDTVINDTVTVIVDPVVNLTINKTVEPGIVKVGETVVFTINVTNNGPSNATQVVIEDIVLEQFNVTACNDTAFSGNKLVIDQLNAGESYAFTITAVALIAGTWDNTANVTCAENDTVVNDTVTVVVDTVVNLTIDKTVDIDHVYVGDTVVFTINVTNNGPSNATQVVIEDIVPAQFNVTGCNDTAYSENKLIITQLNVGESYAFTITATALIAGTWNNTANVTCKENDTVINDTVEVIVDPVVNLTIDKTVEPGHVQVGETVVFTINVTNNGPSNATQVVIEDIVPEQFGNVVCNDSRYMDNKILIEQLNTGDSIVFTLTATALINGTWNNTANVTCAENDTVVNDTVNVTVDPVVNLTIDKTVDIEHVQVGDTIVFTINVTNNGPSNATAVTIEDIVPEQFHVTACNDTSYVDNKIIIDQLNVGDSYAFTITAVALINGTWVNVANVTCDENDTVVEDNATVTVDTVVNLTIDKAVDIDRVSVGDTIVFTINVTNNGPSNATVVTIEDIVPEQFNVTGCNDTSFKNNKLIIEKLDVGESYAFTITTTALIAGTWNNTANVTCDENDTVINDTVTVIVDPVVNLSINKTVEPGRVYVGETVLFTINITNNGPSNATQVEVTDIVPEQFGNVVCNDSAYSNNKIIIAQLNVGDSYVFTLNATALINGTWDNIASAFCAENDTVVEDDAIVIVDPVVNLTVNKTVEPGKVYVGETVVFTINVTNNGPSNATMVEITDVVPEQFGNVACNDTRFENNKIIIERLDVNESIVFTLTATALINGTWNNTASAFCAENDTEVNDTVNVTVDPIVDLSTNKTSDQDVYFVEDIAIWTITVHNANNASNATNVKLIESLPAEFEYIDYYTLNGTYDNETKIWDIGFMANGTDARLIILARAIKVKDNVTNVVAVTCTERDWNLSNNIANKTVDILPLPDPEKNVSNSTPYYHDEVLYYLTINNTGNVTYENVLKVIDSLPEGLEFIRTVSIENANLTDDESVEGQTITWTITNIPAFTKAVITVLVKVNALGNLTNNLTIIGPNGSNQTVNATIDPVPIVDLSTNKTSDKEAYFVDDIVIWSITVHNADNGTNATDVILKDEIPSQFEFINYTATKGTYDNETGIWNISFMENGTNATLTIWTIAKVAVDQVTNTANVTCKETDWNLSNNVDNQTVEIIPLPDPVKTVSNSTPYYHDIVEYNLTIINDGDIDYTNNLTVVDSLPEGLVFIETVGIVNGKFIGDEVIDTNNVTWVVTNISAKTNATIIVKVKVEALGDLTNNLTIIGPNGTNKTVNETVTPVPIVDLSTDKTSDRDEYFVDDIAVWTITIHNADNGTNATNVALEDHIPTQFVFINYTATNGTYDHNTGIWTIGFMGNGTDATLTIWTRAVTPIDEVTNYANVSCYEDEWDLSNNDDEKTVSIIKLPEPQKTVSNTTPYNRDNVTYNLTITNVGNITYTNVLTVIDSLPEGLKFIETVGIDSADLIEEIVDGQKITWTITNISAESSAVITVKVLVMDIGNQTNNLTIVGPNGTNSTVNCTIDPVPIADLAVTKINDYSTKVCYNGDNVTWTISVINNGPNDAINSIASDILPAGLIYVSDDSNGAYDPITGIWTIGNLSVGSSATLTIVTTVATSNETITNYVNVTSDTYDPDESNNEDNSSVVVEPEADLGIVKLVSNETVHKGDIVTWTLIVTNYGTDAAINVVVTDKLPKGLVHIADNSLGAYNPTTGIWNVGNLACGESATLKIKSLVKTTNKNITNLATVDSDTYDPDKSNNNANNSTVVPPECDLVLTIDPNVVEVTVGDEVEFTVTVVNKGPDTAENATAFIEIPDELKLLGFKPSKGTYDPETGIWTIGDLAPGEKVTLILDTEALETGKFVVKAHVVCDTYETDYTNNNDSAEVTVIEPPEPPVLDVPPQEMYPTGNPIVLALLSVLVIVGMTLKRKS